VGPFVQERPSSLCTRCPAVGCPGTRDAIYPGTEQVKGGTEVNVRKEIIAQFEQVAREQNKRLAPLTDGLELLNSGLDSLCFAILVSRLEDSLGLDPFTVSEDAQFPVTFGNFVNLYEHVAK
jgi:hypothetical protein